MTINLTITNKQQPEHTKAVDVEAWEGGKKTLVATLGGGQSTDVVLYDGRTLQLNERALGVAATNPEAVAAEETPNAPTQPEVAPQGEQAMDPQPVAEKPAAATPEAAPAPVAESATAPVEEPAAAEEQPQAVAA